MVDRFHIFAVGIIKKTDKAFTIEIYEEYKDTLFGLDQFSHILVFSWFNKNDTPQRRRIFKVHPKGDKENPLTGVFATRSPVRPNPIAISICKILSIDGNNINIDKIDAFDGTPVIDIKPYSPKFNSVMDVIKVPR